MTGHHHCQPCHLWLGARSSQWVMGFRGQELQAHQVTLVKQEEEVLVARIAPQMALQM